MNSCAGVNYSVNATSNSPSSVTNEFQAIEEFDGPRTHFSIMFKKDSRAAGYVDLLLELPLLLSFMSYAELHQWARFRRWGDARVRALENFLEDYALLMPNKQICQRWASVRAECRSKGRPISTQDAWNAAVALHFSVPLVTNNVTDYEPLEQLTILTAPPP